VTAKELKAVRQSLGLTQQGLADVLHVSRVTVARWEIGERSVSGPVALLLQPGLEILVANEPGIRGNVDSEFLHDYRVAVRRTRSAPTWQSCSGCRYCWLFPTGSVA
jgi:transcriptional regulator with XRE-family HTH domain